VVDANDKRLFCNHMIAIMHYQEEFLLMEMTKLKPMILKDIADLVGLDISNFT
jgi:RNA polymerase sigma-54 factor